MSRNAYEEARALIGKEGPPEIGLDEVCRQMIRHCCEAVEDANPVYTSDDYARKSKYGSIIAPPMMVKAWAMRPLWPDGAEEHYRHPEKQSVEPLSPHQEAVDLLNKAGFTGYFAASTTYEFFKPLFPGDRVTCTTRLGDVSPEKTTKAGIGHFVTVVYSYTNQNGELVCAQRLTVLKFRPGTA